MLASRPEPLRRASTQAQRAARRFHADEPRQSYPRPGKKRIASGSSVSIELLASQPLQPPYLPRCLRTWQETSLVMARFFRFYTDTTIRTYEPPRRSGLPNIWKIVRRSGGAMANAMAPVTKANAMPRPPLDDETTLSGNIPLIGEDMGWFPVSFCPSTTSPTPPPSPPPSPPQGLRPWLGRGAREGSRYGWADVGWLHKPRWWLAERCSVPTRPRWTSGALTPHFPKFPHARPPGIPTTKRVTQPGMPAGCDALWPKPLGPEPWLGKSCSGGRCWELMRHRAGVLLFFESCRHGRVAPISKLTCFFSHRQSALTRIIVRSA